MPSFIGQLRGLPKSSVVVRNVCSSAVRRGVGIAQWLDSFSLRPCGLRDFALGWYRVKSFRRSWVKVSGSRRRECAAYSHAYLSGEIRVGDMMDPEGVCNPIMGLPMVFQGEEGGTSVAYGPILGIESLSGSPSSKMIWRRSECARLLGRGGDDGGARFGDFSRVEGDDGAIARIFTRVGACADELR